MTTVIWRMRVASTTKRGGKHRGLVRVAGFPSESKSFDTRREALAWAVAREAELRERRVTHPNASVDAIFERYVKEIAPKRGLAPSHLKHDVPSVRRRLKGLTVGALLGNGLTQWVMANSDVSASSRNWLVSRLYGVLREAEHHWDIAVPWEDMDRCRKHLKRMGYMRPAGERDRRISDAEIARIKMALGRQVSVRMRDIIDFCLQSCMRISEVCRIEWRDLNVQARTIVIRDRKHPTRKYGNHCVVPLLNGSFETLMKQPRRGDLIFPHHGINISRKFHEAAKRAGVEDVVLHDLRHEGISRLFELGFQIQEVAMVSGHKDWRVLRRYTHLKPEGLVAREEALRAMQKKSGAEPARRPVAEV